MGWTSLATQTINSLQNYFDFVHNLLLQYPKGLWFRGVGDATYDLQPSILRHSQVVNLDQMKTMERDLIQRFSERSIPYLQNRLEDTWEKLFLMQHYGIPTRLLDWTESPTIALFFALSSAHHNGQNGCAVWTLCPIKLNSVTFAHLGAAANQGARSVNDHFIDGYKPDVISNANPAAVYGIHNSPRIVAQRGSFTIQGNDLTPLNQIYQNSANWPQDTLEKIIIPQDIITDMLKMLITMGTTDATIYPDLSGLSMEIKRNFGYRV